MTTESVQTKTKDFLGHPGGLSTLFLTEMWERMSYYGMRAMLVLFMTASIQEGGLAITVASATAIYGLYTGSVYLMGLPGGWMADRLIGGQKAVWYGGIIIMFGHIVLAIPNDHTFFIGLILVVLGTGLLKPNIGAMVGHWAFGAAAVGMAIGLVLYKLTLSKLDGAGAEPTVKLSPKAAKISWSIIGLFLLAVVVVAYMLMNNLMAFNAVVVAQKFAILATVIFLGYFAAIFFLGNNSPNEKRQLGALFLVCIASIFFWTGFEQAGSSLNLFGQNYTDRIIGTFEIPPEWLQSANSMFIVILSPFFAAMWINMAKKMITPSYGLKCAIGLIIMASGFLVMFFAAQVAATGLKVAPYWLIATYFLHTVGELCLSPVALSAVSKLSPKRFAGQMMGVFVLTYSIGNVVAGLLAGNFDPNKVEDMPNLYLQISLFTISIGAVIFLFTFKTKKWEKLAEQPAN
jgi:POT family proton-dependent oligopeptide transporter